MSTAAAQDAGERIAAALRTVPDLRVSLGPPAGLSPPAAVVWYPRLEWTGFCPGGPARGQWAVYLVVNLSEYAPGQLLGLIGSVTAAIDTVDGAVVTRATPGVYPAANQPAYEIEIEMELS